MDHLIFAHNSTLCPSFSITLWLFILRSFALI